MMDANRPRQGAFRSWSRAAGLVGLFALGLGLGACSDSPGQAVLFDGAAPDLPNRPDQAPQPDLGAVDPNGPTVEFLSPQEGQTVLVSTLRVEVRVTDPNGAGIDAVKVKLDAGDEVVMSQTTTPNVYEALLDISKLSGEGILVATATNLATEDPNDPKTTGCPCSNSVSRRFARDGGPVIIFKNPLQDSRHRNSVGVLVQVEDTRPITSFEVRIGSQVLTLKKQVLEDTPQKKVNTYSGTVTFDDKIFGSPLTGTQVLTATAANDNSAVNTAQQRFVIDDSGPTITPISHAAGDLIGGVIQLEVKVEDLAGVLDSSVRVIIGNNLDVRQVALTPKPGSASIYEGQFDTRTLRSDTILPVMSFRAADRLGNENTADIKVWLDNGQPILSLDPSNQYYARKKEDKKYVCTLPFDPVGDDAASDKEEVPQITTIRVRIEDQGNLSAVPSALWAEEAAVDPNSAVLYVLDDTSKPLVVDSTGDGFCDSINPDVVPLAGNPLPGQAVAVSLVPIPVSGTPNYTPLPSGWTGYPLPPVPVCDGWGGDDLSDELCLPTLAPTFASSARNHLLPFHYAIGDDGDTARPAIYVPGPAVAGDKFRCAGLPFDFLANQITPGWTCVAATAKDNLGLRGVSMPMRLYYDATLQTYVKGKFRSGEPNCTGTIDATGKVTTTPCAFRTSNQAFPQVFPDIEVVGP